MARLSASTSHSWPACATAWLPCTGQPGRGHCWPPQSPRHRHQNRRSLVRHLPVVPTPELSLQGLRIQDDVPLMTLLSCAELHCAHVLHSGYGLVTCGSWLRSHSGTSPDTCSPQAGGRCKRGFPAIASRSRRRRQRQHCSCCGSCAIGSNSCASTPAAAIGMSH